MTQGLVKGAARVARQWAEETIRALCASCGQTFQMNRLDAFNGERPICPVCQPKGREYRTNVLY